MREKQVSAVLGPGNMKFNIVNEIKLSYSRKGNCERSISSSVDAVDIFREHFDAEEMELQGIVLCAVSESGEQGFGN